MKKITTIGFMLMFGSCVAQTDTTKINYLEIFQMDTTNFHAEMFFGKMAERYSVFGPIGMIMTSGDSVDRKTWQFDTICIEFLNPRRHFECFTPEQAEEKRNKIIQK